MSGAAFVCGSKGCGKPVKGIYCPEHLARRMAEALEIKEARSRMMRERWRNDREGMLAAIAAGRAPAEEGAES